MHQDYVKNKKNKAENNEVTTKVEEEKQEDDLLDRETLQVKLLDMIKQLNKKSHALL